MRNEITLQQLINIAKQFTQDEYKVEFNIPVKINNRLRRTLGRYRETRTGKPIQIDLSGKLLTHAHEQVAIGVMKHEAVHYALKKLNKPYNDGDEYFEKELRRLKLPSSINKKYSVLFVGEQYIFKCIKCNRQLMTTIKKVERESNSYLSSCCQSKLSYVRTIICDGTDNGSCLFLK